MGRERARFDCFAFRFPLPPGAVELRQRKEREVLREAHGEPLDVPADLLVNTHPEPNRNGTLGFPGGTGGEGLAGQRRGRKRCKRRGWDPGVGKTPWRRARQPTPAFLPGGPHGQRSLAGHSPRGHAESDTTEATWHACLKVPRRESYYDRR